MKRLIYVTRAQDCVRAIGMMVAPPCGYPEPMTKPRNSFAACDVENATGYRLAVNNKLRGEHGAPYDATIAPWQGFRGVSLSRFKQSRQKR